MRKYRKRKKIFRRWNGEGFMTIITIKSISEKKYCFRIETRLKSKPEINITKPLQTIRRKDNKSNFVLIKTE
jgi:hypothetical protein